jgi:PAS domain S-box-containing protein
MKPIIRILMLEDSIEDAELLNRELRRGGMSFDVRRVDTREDFLEQLKGFKPDIVISDYKLPSFGGMDALKLVQKISSPVPFILVSGHIGELGAIEAFKMGVTDFVLKDSVGRLVPSVRRALREGKERAEYRRLEQRFRLLFESAPSAMVMINALGQIEMINGQTERMFGYPRAELSGRSIETLLPERLRAHNRASGSSFFSTAQQLPMGAEPGLFGLTRDAIEFPIDIGLNPIETEDGVMALVVILDITVRRQAEREKEQQRRELERSNADLERFAYVASHDLRAPLHAIARLAEWVRVDIAAIASSEAVENLELLQGRALRLQMLLDGLLAYSRVGQVGSPIEDVDIAALVRDIADVLAPPPGFLIACAGTMPSLHTRRSPILVVLQNLIANGLKHHDRAEGRVTVSAHVVDEVAEFRVSDDGPGIPPQFHDRVFEIFQTLQSRDEVDSSGIGLSIVKKEVESHGGRIWIESTPPERGTTFIFTWRQLPR